METNAPQRQATRGGRRAAREDVGRRRRLKRHDEVLAAAAKVFYRHGYAAATVQDIADELQILRGSLYHYIETKEDLLFRLFEQAAAQADRLLEEVAAAEDLDPLERLRGYLCARIARSLEHPERAWIYHHELERLGEAHRAAVRQWQHRHDSALAGMVQAAQRGGFVDPSLDPATLADCVATSLVWAQRWAPDDRSRTPEGAADGCADFVLWGLVGRPSTA